MVAPSKRPNFLIVLADDLGYSDIGCYGGEIRTPNIDSLAEEGLRFSDYHTSPLCSVTRAMLMSGTDCHLAGLGCMNENPSLNSDWKDRRGFEGYMNKDVVSFPELLKDSNYMTIMSGKWHIGYERGYIPCDRGFVKSFSMLCGAQNHFGWNPDWQAAGETKMPKPLGGNNPTYVFEDKRWLPTPNLNEDPNGYYSSYFFADTLVDFLKDSAEERSESDQPFFAYLPFSAPHTPIQCFTSDREHYTGVYDDGPFALREKRMENMAKMGFIDPDVKPHEVLSHTKEWDEWTTEQQRHSSRGYECYAGMVEALDRATGRVIDYLRSTGELDNTVVMFFSDNGPASGSLGDQNYADELQDMLGKDIEGNISKFYKNDFENLGKYDSCPRPSPLWAQASTAPHRLYKGMPTEGGIRVPLVVRYPGFTQHHKTGSITHAFTTVMDIMPTILSMAGVRHPNASPATPITKAPWRDQMVYPMRGQDWTPYFLHGESTKNATPQALSEQTARLVGRAKLFISPDEDRAVWGEESPAVGWEIHGRAAVRKGKWKILNMEKSYWGTEQWQLYDMDADQGETNDLADSHPDIMKEMLGYWEQYKHETGAYLRREHPEWPPLVKEKGPQRPGQLKWMKLPVGGALAETPA